MAKSKKGKKGKGQQKKQNTLNNDNNDDNNNNSSTVNANTNVKQPVNGEPSGISTKNVTVNGTSTTTTIKFPGSTENIKFSANLHNTGSTSTTTTTTTTNAPNNSGSKSKLNTPTSTAAGTDTKDNDDLSWLRDCDTRVDSKGQPYLQLEYRDDDTIMLYLQQFLEQSSAQKQVVDEFYQIWQQTVLSTLLEMTAVWQKDHVTPDDQRQMKERLKKARYKISFLLHRVMGGMLTSHLTKWQQRRHDLLQICFQTLQLLPRLAESCPHHKTDIRQVIIHFEGKEFLASCACETWDTLYDHAVSLDPKLFVPILRRCAMLDILDKDWNMLGGWEDILKALEAKCFLDYGPVPRLPSDAVLQETTTILRNARNSMQCKFFSVRFLRYTDDQAPQRWRYFPKCSAPACANLETPQKIHTLRCTNCWYFHYCSQSCQEYCDSIMGLHPKFCNDTPKDKAAQCRKEMEQYLGINQDPDMTCHACGLEEQHVLAEGMKRCSQCQKVFYCSRQCQVNSEYHRQTDQKSLSFSSFNPCMDSSNTIPLDCYIFFILQQEWDWPNHKRLCQPAKQSFSIDSDLA